MKKFTDNNYEYELAPEEYEEIVNVVEALINKCHTISETDEWLTLWRCLHKVELYPMTDIDGAPRTFEDAYDMKYVLVFTRPIEGEVVSPRTLKSFIDDARRNDYEVVVALPVVDGIARALLIETSSGNLTPVDIRYDANNNSYDLD